MASEIIRRYENYLMNNEKLSFYGTKEEKHKEVLELIRYVVSDLLMWEPQAASECMDKYYFDLFKLSGFIHHLILPLDVLPTDYDYIIYMAFPNDVYINEKEQMIKMYERICKNEGIKRFPKKYFKGENGKYKLAILLEHIINTKVPSKTTAELYEYFSNSSEVNNLLRECGIYTPYRMYYANPLQCLHFSLPKYQQDEFLFSYYSYMLVFKNLNQRLFKKHEDCVKKAYNK